MRWACDCLNRTSTTGNPENKSPYEMWQGKTAVLQLLPFLKPGFCRRKRGHKLEPKAQQCYYLGPFMNHPHDAMRVLTKERIVVTTRNVTWRRIPAIQQRPLAFGRVERPQEDGDDGGALEFGIVPNCGDHGGRGTREQETASQLNAGARGVVRCEAELQPSGVDERERGADALTQESSSDVSVEGTSRVNTPDIVEPKSKSEEGSEDVNDVPVDVEVDDGVEVEADAPDDPPRTDDGPPSRRTRSRTTAANYNVGLTAPLDKKSVLEVSYALTGKVELDTAEDKVPYFPLSDIEPEP